MLNDLWQNVLEALPDSWTQPKEPGKHDHEQDNCPPTGSLQSIIINRKKKKPNSGMASNERSVNDKSENAIRPEQKKKFPKFSYNSDKMKKRGKHPSLRPNCPKQEHEQYNNMER